MRIKEIKIDDEFKSILPELTNDEYSALQENIAVHGIQQPLILWNGVLIDGHNRYKVCKDGGIDEAPVISMDFDSRDDVIEWILKNQLGRRNLSIHQRNIIALKYENIISEKAKQRQISGLINQKSSLAPTGSNERTNETIAKIAGTSRTSVIRSKLILDRGTPEQKERALRGGKYNSLSKIENEIRGWKNGHKVREKEKINEQEENNESVNEAEKRICRVCGNALLPGEYVKGKGNICRRCRNQISNGKVRDIKGNVMNIAPEYADLKEADIIGDLYDQDKEITHTNDDLREELEVNVSKFLESIESTLQFYEELLESPSGRLVVRQQINILVGKATKLKEKYANE